MNKERTDDVSLQVEFHSLLISLSNPAKISCLLDLFAYQFIWLPFHYSLGLSVIALFVRF